MAWTKYLIYFVFRVRKSLQKILSLSSFLGLFVQNKNIYRPILNFCFTSCIGDYSYTTNETKKRGGGFVQFDTKRMKDWSNSNMTNVNHLIWWSHGLSLPQLFPQTLNHWRRQTRPVTFFTIRRIIRWIKAASISRCRGHCVAGGRWCVCVCLRGGGLCNASGWKRPHGSSVNKSY